MVSTAAGAGGTGWFKVKGERLKVKGILCARRQIAKRPKLFPALPE